ncbi:mediator of RNA polymerase II transcription subunit 18 [Geospiza fortis]|uniref:Mediator of RNA polymerase II transcription subunit 18 n=1 Tax=Geospiza fortis TaxID=48883 RepID=A0A6I9HQW2_GEOFO|nr:mediator of RNA polymerase II transcription subunit 18 [Geospiza fortis]
MTVTTVSLTTKRRPKAGEEPWLQTKRALLLEKQEIQLANRGQQASPFVLRARRSMDRRGMPWHLRYLGQPEIGDKNRHALVRNCVDIATSDNLTDFLVEMGFRMDHEFVAKGHVFRKGIMKIVVYKIFRILMPGNTESIEPLSLSYLVELNVVAPAGQDIVSDDMRNFAEQLKPLVHLEKIDPKRLM